MTRAGGLTALAAVVLGVVGVLLSYPEVLALGCGFATLVVLSAGWVWLAPDLKVNRTLVPSRVFEGGEALSRLTFTNRRRTRSPAVLGHELVGSDRVPVRVPPLRSGGSAVEDVPLPTGRRGRHDLPPLLLRGADPLGLFDLNRSAGEASVLWVYPKPHELAGFDETDARELDATIWTRALPGGSTFDGLRAYQPEDDSRLIHWPSYARSGELMVRHHVVASESRYLVVLDLADVYGDEAAFEAAVRVAASWYDGALRARAAITLLTTDGSMVQAGNAETDPEGGRRIWEALAQVRRRTGCLGPESLGVVVRRVPATSLTWVTGHLAPDLADAVGELGRTMSSTVLARIGGHLPPKIASRPGLVEISAAGSLEWTAAWGDAVDSP